MIFKKKAEYNPIFKNSLKLLLFRLIHRLYLIYYYVISLNNIKCDIIDIKIIYKKFYIKENRDTR